MSVFDDYPVLKKYPKHAEVVKFLRSCIGIHEAPNGSNRGPGTPGVSWFQRFDFIRGEGYPWCVCPWLAAWAHAARRPLPYKSPGAYAQGNWARRAGWATQNPIPGDGVVLRMGAGHFATFLEFQGDLVKVIEGNASNRVKYGFYRRSQVHTFIHVPEAKVSLPRPAQKRVNKEPLFDVATSENGHRVFLTTQRGYKALAKVLPRFAKRIEKGGLTINLRKKKR